MRNQFKIFWGSSYDRGLEHLLKMWPDIKRDVPEAELHVFYGWDLFDTVYIKNAYNPERAAWKDKINKLMEQDGITHHGRVGHEELREAIESSGIWAYPTHFYEISCITAMKCQAWGAVPVVMNYGALKETVQHGIKVDGDIYDKETQNVFCNELIALLKDPERQEEIRKEMMPWASSRFGWDAVAKQWGKEFKRPVTLARQWEKLAKADQPLRFWEMISEIPVDQLSEDEKALKGTVWASIKHAFNKDDYERLYKESEVEVPVSEDQAFGITEVLPRMKWVVDQIQKRRLTSVIDVGCADGYLGLTLGTLGIPSVGLNLNGRSVELANERAKQHGLHDTRFIETNFMDYAADKKYDAVVFFEMLEHMPQPVRAVQKLFEFGDTVFISTPKPGFWGVRGNEEGWNNGKPKGHLKLYSEEELRGMFSDYNLDGFHEDESELYCFVLTKKG